MNTQLYQPEMLLQQPMPQQGAGLQGQGRGNPLSWNFPSTATQVYQTVSYIFEKKIFNYLLAAKLT